MNITKQQYYSLVKQAKTIYSRQGNISEFLRNSLLLERNTPEIIEIAYDLQAGSYVNQALKNPIQQGNYCDELARYLDKYLTKDDSLLEIGCGEATTTFSVFQSLTNKPSHVLGFDISFSRIKVAIKFWTHKYNKYINLVDAQSITSRFFIADLFSIPLSDKSVDIVYTSHSIEPNGGREVEALRSIFRIAKKRVLLFEPYFEAASPEGQARMSSHGYIKEIPKAIQEAGGKLQDIQKIEHIGNPLNPTYLFDIEIEIDSDPLVNPSIWADPITLNPLYEQNDCFYSPTAGLAYPVIQGIPCLRPEQAIIATHLLDDLDIPQ
jgi:ubiquinone/menaquinone biosynthesis C-methylase UbiE